MKRKVFQEFDRFEYVTIVARLISGSQMFILRSGLDSVYVKMGRKVILPSELVDRIQENIKSCGIADIIRHRSASKKMFYKNLEIGNRIQQRWMAKQNKRKLIVPKDFFRESK